MRWSAIDWIAWALIIIGGLNWGLIGFANMNVVDALFGTTTLSRFVYGVVGLGALWQLFSVLAKSQTPRA
ncbi:hypothetical protein URH17368_2834 [Alicyclobacillus hesperidum URH17-3-68]|uniref:DUF378 domain-containing protein n=1 Tax=Alicyclobacillus hesperidum TaxID=89784 RepID=A0A1H2V7X0_9BACL|nr:DUF378 domain-containing protein [Alicyclobacillus hesperidum]EJY54546.1 hypothetical protein URH17368_2834 [Alicyclobacillus hesperidum URH17-3-68]GLV14881.1 hypothetical protein Heshes_25650 [Alicyclobacillus hesperidum]SDW64436.1 hypothetical protein SAMN04489725_11033 [Alicyclobacillus hesperidum]